MVQGLLHGRRRNGCGLGIPRSRWGYRMVVTNDLCRSCGHPMAAHEQIDHWSTEAGAVVGPTVDLPRYTTVCTQGRPVLVDDATSPWDHVCGCAWSHDEPRELVA